MVQLLKMWPGEGSHPLPAGHQLPVRDLWPLNQILIRYTKNLKPSYPSTSRPPPGRSTRHSTPSCATIPYPTQPADPDLPWVSEIRIPVAKETNPKTGKIYTNVEAAWFDKPGIDDIAAELASRWCQPPELLGQYDKYAEGGIYWCINPITPAYLENYGSTLQRRKTGTARDVDVVARYWLPIDADATPQRDH